MGCEVERVGWNGMSLAVFETTTTTTTKMVMMGLTMALVAVLVVSIPQERSA